MTENLVGLNPTDAFHNNSAPTADNNEVVPADHVNLFGFSDGVSKQVTFVAVWDVISSNVAINLRPPNFNFEYATVRHLQPEGHEADAQATTIPAVASFDEYGLVVVDGAGDFDVMMCSRRHR